MGLLTEDLELRGDVTVTGNFYPPQSSIKNGHISADAADRIASAKVVHQFSVDAELAEQATTVAAVARLLHIVRGNTATLQGVEVAVVSVPTGDYAVTVDLQKSSGGGAFSTVLATAITINSSTSALTPVVGTLSSASLSDGDILKLVVTVSGTTGMQAKGLLVSVTIAEDPS